MRHVAIWILVVGCETQRDTPETAVPSGPAGAVASQAPTTSAGAVASQPPTTSAGAVASQAPTSSAAAPVSATAAPLGAASYGPRPERPVPKTTPTVTLRMPVETQLKAISYMMAMRSPLPGDAAADPDFAKEIAGLARPAVAALDRGTAGDKAKLDRVDVIGSGRQLDFLVAAGCDAQMPKQVVQKIGKTLPALLEKGVLVLRCADRNAQCFQSTRDASDVLCTYEHRK